VGRKRADEAEMGRPPCQWDEDGETCDGELRWWNPTGLCGPHQSAWKKKYGNRMMPVRPSEIKRRSVDQYVYLDDLSDLLERLRDENGRRWTFAELGRKIGLEGDKSRYITKWARAETVPGGARCAVPMAKKLAKALGVAYKDLGPRKA
jgi:hypothetical protein